VGLVAIGLLIANQPLLEEWLNILPPAPSAEIERLARATTMTPSAQRLFYRQQPSIESQRAFLSQCQVPNKAIMLGCYVQRGRVGKIVLQQVTDPRLSGTMEVTAAHEMLHAAYAQLNSSERHQLDDRLSRAAKRVKDQRLLSVLQEYRAQDIGLYRNELHSHLGTELADLGDPQLEQYYQRYFHDRQRIVAFANRSSSTLRKLDKTAANLKPEIDQLEAELQQLEQILQAAEARLKNSHQNLNVLQTQLQSTKSLAEAALRQGSLEADQLATEFALQKASFNQQVDQHNELAQLQASRIAAFNNQVKTYKQKIKQYNQAARESRNILDSLTSHPPPAP
jgi:chromosome segregation ATPase